MNDGRDGRCREGHTADGEQADGADVVAELAPAHRYAGRVDQRRQYQQKHQFRCELDLRQPRSYGEHEADQDHDDCRRKLRSACHYSSHRDGRENENQKKVRLHKPAPGRTSHQAS